MNPYIISLIASFVIQIFFFVFAATFKTDKVTDLSYGLSFILITLFVFFQNETHSFLQSLIALLVILWGIRLAGYLLIRIVKIKKDARFDGIRENFFKFAGFWTFQAVTVWAVLIPVTFILSLKTLPELTTLSIIGILLWVIGFVIETVSDHQKFVFKNKNKKGFISSGLWKYSRHPNYFGEILLWWGIFIAIIPFLSGLEYFTIIGPLFIMMILLFFSGIPPLEQKYDKRYAKDKSYQKYKKETSILIPLPKK